MAVLLTGHISYGCQNSKSLNGLLKDELGFQGYVMSDWAATHSGVSAIEAGLVSGSTNRLHVRVYSLLEISRS
jgi:beta-glucosidase-like glycosyl hydrolase